GPQQRIRRRPWPARLGQGLLAAVQGRRMVLANIDPLVTALYRAGGRLLFTRVMAVLMTAVAAIGLVAFGWQWWTGEQSVFLTDDSYAKGAAVLLGLNVLALAAHELGHALAAKHAGRRVPAAGFLVYFGIPSVFVDTTDVWMAGRRARLRTTLAGPAAGLVLAGASALVGLVFPTLAPWCFKLSFAWYVNALFNLNPFLALDGYYLVMDWLELPNLRPRGLAWVAARIRRRPLRWRALDREGRLVALYGLLAVGWLVVALNLGYRVYADRVWGVTLGLWRAGWAAQLLLVVLVAALAAPVVFVLCGWTVKKLRRLRERFVERRRDRDAPRRLDALRRSGLRDLPAAALVQLAAQARWVRPRTGEQLVFAGAAQPELFTVVDGALEARAPGDPGGTVRERVGVGGIVGLGPALTGSPSPLAWYAAGTQLLAIPSSAVAAAVGPIGATLGSGSVVEAEALFTESPALAGLPAADRLGLAAAAQPVNLAPDAPIELRGPDDAIVLAAGIITLPAGDDLGRGTLIGPAGGDHPGAVAHARTPVRLFRVPAVSGAALLLGAAGPSTEPMSAGTAPVFGVHPPHAYPPLAVPPGPPQPTGDDSVDRRFEKRLRWLLLLVLLLGFFLTTANLFIGPLAWGEMPGDHALLRVQRGSASAVVDGRAMALGVEDAVYVSRDDTIAVDPRSRALLTYRGGASSILCAGTAVTVGPLASAGHPIEPTAVLALDQGLVLTDSFTRSAAAFAPLAARITSAAGDAVNDGPAWFAVAPWGVIVAEGEVSLAGRPQAPTHAPLGCGDGDATVVRPSATSSVPPATPSPTPAPTVSAGPTATPTTTSTTAPPTTTHPAPSTGPPADTTPPTISGVRIVDARGLPGQVIFEEKCGSPTVAFVIANVTDNVGVAEVRFDYTFVRGNHPDGTTTMTPSTVGDFRGQLGSFPFDDKNNGNGDLVVTVNAIDAAGNRANPVQTRIGFGDCSIIG
ncbi:MAG: hypothetical protein ACM30G_08060, partial [Micromonosporaceae bacterium]